VELARDMVGFREEAQPNGHEGHLLLRLCTDDVEEHTINQPLLVLNERGRDLALVGDARGEDADELGVRLPKRHE
jgi:hypothetical protein